VIPRAAAGFVSALALTAARPELVAAQLLQAQPARYLLTTEAADARAVWVNPAGLARSVEASVGADVTAERSGGGARLQQFGVTLLSRNFAAGWSHDSYGGASGSADNYVVGTGLGDSLLSIGAARRWYRGRTGDTAWDLALRARVTPILDASVVWRNIGSPTVRDSIYYASIIPALGVHARDGRLGAAVELDMRTSLGTVREIRAGASIAFGPHFRACLRGEFSPSFDRRGFTVAITWAAAKSRSTLVTILPADASSIDAVGAAGAVVATPEAGSRR